jgi:hypothetical protein
MNDLNSANYSYNPVPAAMGYIFSSMEQKWDGVEALRTPMEDQQVRRGLGW